MLSDVALHVNTRYHEADIRTGKATYWQLTSLQAFWPGLQVIFEKFDTFTLTIR